MGAYPAISDYGLIGNGRTAALISKFGAVEWLCFPFFDSPSYFAALLDRDRGGHFTLCPSTEFKSAQKYFGETNILETDFHTATGKARVLDCFTVESELKKKKELWPDYEILRVVECLEGEVEMQVKFAPRPNYGKTTPKIHRRGRIGIVAESGHDIMFLRSELHESLFRIEGGEVAATFTMRAGDVVRFSLIYSSDAPTVLPPLGIYAEQRFERTRAYWKSWAERCHYDGPYLGEVRRSALTLKLLTFAPSGAVVAAPTTSLPEWIGGIRNWDYRFSWLRDSSFIVRALMMLGHFEEAEAYVNWVLDTGLTHAEDYRNLYSLWGEVLAPEKDLLDIHGYRGSKPVRIGNAASHQFQLDIYGEVIDAVHILARHHMSFDGETRNLLLDLGKRVERHWRDPDAGIWEMRGTREHRTHSKVMCWVAMNRLADLCACQGWKAPIQKYRTLASEVRLAIERRGFHPQVHAYTSSFGSLSMDAAVLVMPLVGYCEARSERMVSTRERVARELGVDGLLYRYRAEDDGLPGTEGCFGVCSFWLIDNYSKAGDFKTARRLMDSFLKRGNCTRLWPEEFDPKSGAFLGNYPQGFTHVGLINSALTLEQEEKAHGKPGEKGKKAA